MPRRGQRLFLKYMVASVILVSGVLLASGGVELYYSYQENQRAIGALQREQAAAAAARIEQFMAEAAGDVAWASQTPAAATVDGIEQRRADYLRLLRLAPAVTEVSYLDSSGRERLWVSRLGMNAVDRLIDYAGDARFAQARTGQTYFGPMYFRNNSEPYMTISVGERGQSGGVTTTEVNLKFVWDVVSRITIGKAGDAFVVDAEGQLLAHPDISQVLRRSDLSGVAQVQEARAGSGARADGPRTATVARDLNGREVLTSFEMVPSTGWLVFVEQPVEEALAPVYASLQRTAVLLVLGLAVAVLASLIYARRMVAPIHALQAGAARIGAGALDQRIAVQTRDELGQLADEFNRMAAQLQESYAELEGKVEDRTHELGEALEEIQEKNDELEVASRHKSEFLANMSHELRTPLNAIIGFSEVLTERMFGDLNERQDDYLNDILSSGRHLLSLINDILDLSKVEAGQMDLEIESVLLPEALQNGITMVRERASNHGIALNLLVDPGLGAIQADERKVKQVIFNLLSNAVKFTPDGGRVEVRATLVGEEVHIAVQDTGIGIAPEEQQLVFEEFRQAGRAEGAKTEGTGLGLALVKRFVEMHGGRVWLESEVGVGSTFTVALPARPALAALVGGLATQPGATDDLPALTLGRTAGQEASSPTVLLVEDDRHSIDLLTLYLREVGLAVAVARSGEEGLDLARRLRPAAIVLDVLLPGLDGWEFIAQARADPLLSHTPLIVTTVVDERGKGLALGAAAYLVKPVQRAELLGAIEALALPSVARGSPVKVVAIDDERMAIELIEAVLAPEGYLVLSASGGEEGIALAQRELPDLVILDLMMPEVDGFAVVERLRVDPATARIPIVVLTAKTMSPEDRERLAGRISFLAQKADFSREAFVELIQRYCQPAPA